MVVDNLQQTTSVTLCLHFIAGRTTSCVNYANERSQAALERSSQDAYDAITRSKAADVNSALHPSGVA